MSNRGGTPIRDNVFVVTGGGNGIGRETVLQLLLKGAKVIAVDVSEAGLAETAGLANAGPRLTVKRVDISDRAAVQTLTDEVIAEHGRVDGVLNIAGIVQPFVAISEVDYAVIERVMGVNFWGVINTVTSFLPHLMTRPTASLVNVSSMGAFVAVPGQTAYGASKAAVKLLTDGLYVELLDTPVRVTAVFPGAIETDIVDNSGAEAPTLDDLDTPPMTSPAEAARQIIEAVEKGSYRVVIGKDAKGLDIFSRLAPRHAAEFVAKKLKSLTN